MGVHKIPVLRAGQLKQLQILHDFFGVSKSRQIAARLAELDKMVTHYDLVEAEHISLYLYTLCSSEIYADVQDVVKEAESVKDSEGRPFLYVLDHILVHPDQIEANVKNVMIHKNKAVIQYNDRPDYVFSNGKDKPTDVLISFPMPFILELAQRLEGEDSEYTWSKA